MSHHLNQHYFSIVPRAQQLSDSNCSTRWGGDAENKLLNIDLQITSSSQGHQSVEEGRKREWMTNFYQLESHKPTNIAGDFCIQNSIQPLVKRDSIQIKQIQPSQKVLKISWTTNIIPSWNLISHSKHYCFTTSQPINIFSHISTRDHSGGIKSELIKLRRNNLQALVQVWRLFQEIFSFV